MPLSDMDKANYKSMNSEQLLRINDQLLDGRIPMHKVTERNAHLACIAQELHLGRSIARVRASAARRKAARAS